MLGFTDHDRPLRFEDTDFRADSGLDATAVQSATGLGVDNAQAMGALSDISISEADLRAGRFDDADIDCWLVDWVHPDRRVHLFRGSLGEIRRRDGAFEAELRGLTQALNVPVGRVIKRTCDRVVGDAKCKVELGDPRYRLEGEIAGAEGGSRLRTGGQGFPEAWFSGGKLVWLSGQNAGLPEAVRTDRLEGEMRVLQLAAEPPLAVNPGDRFELTAGCNKTSETCRSKFYNFLNFRGFPHIPGEDWVVAYPKSGGTHDGSSLRRR